MTIVELSHWCPRDIRNATEALPEKFVKSECGSCHGKGERLDRFDHLIWNALTEDFHDESRFARMVRKKLWGKCGGSGAYPTLTVTCLPCKGRGWYLHPAYKDPAEQSQDTVEEE